MRRLVYRIPLIVSLIVLIVSAGMLIRSFFVLDELSLADKDSRVWAALSYRGGVHLIRSAPDRAAPRSVTWDSYEIPPHDTWADLYTTAHVQWKFLGLMFLRKSPPTVVIATTRMTLAATPPPAVMRFSLVPWITFLDYDAVCIPYWPIVLLAAILPARFLYIILLRQWRRRHNRCEICGYDLRASEGICPECGNTKRAIEKVAGEGVAR